MKLPASERAEIVKLSGLLERAAWGHRQALVAQAATDRGVSAGTIWRWLQEVRGRRRTRKCGSRTADCGLDNGISPVAMAVAQVKQKVLRNGRTMSTERALQQIGMAAVLETGEVISRATIDRQIRQARLLTPTIIHEKKISERPNDMHQFDVTGSKVLYVKEKGTDGDWILETRSRRFRRNQAAERMGLWIYGVVDDYSRVRYCQYVVAGGESFEDGKYFLSRAWGGDPRCELRGLPRELNCDYGPLRHSERGQHLMESLGVAFTPRMPESPNTGGKIERVWPDVFRDFESLFDMCDNTQIALHALNDELCAWNAERNRRAHPDCPSLTRLESYASLSPDSVRYFPEEIADAIYSEHVRVIDEFSRFRYRNCWYRVPDRWTASPAECTSNVDVIESYDGRILARNVRTQEVIAAPIAEASLWGTYRGHLDTTNEKLRKAVAEKQFDRVSFNHQGTKDTKNGEILTGKFGAEAEISSPFTAHEAERKFVNEDEAVAWAHARYGLDIFIRNLGLSEAMKAMAKAVELDKAAFAAQVDSLVEAAG
jgi:hypothetical protein